MSQYHHTCQLACRALKKPHALFSAIRSSLKYNHRLNTACTVFLHRRHHYHDFKWPLLPSNSLLSSKSTTGQKFHNSINCSYNFKYIHNYSFQPQYHKLPLRPQSIHKKSTLQGILTAFFLIFGGSFGYIFIKSQLMNENVFIPLYITPKTRRSISPFGIVPEIEDDPTNCDSIFQLYQIPPDDFFTESEMKFQVASQLYSRLAVDETVSAIVGVPVSKPCDDDFEGIEARMMASKHYWVVGIQIMGKVNAKEWLRGKTQKYIHMSDNSREPQSNSANNNDSKFSCQLYYRKQARVLLTDHGVKALLASLFWGNPPSDSDFGDVNSGGGLIGTTTINGHAGPSEPLVEIAGDGNGDPGDVIVVNGDGDESGNGNSDGSGLNGHGNGKNNGNQKKNRNLKKNKNDIQVVMKGIVKVRGPGHGNHSFAKAKVENTVHISNSGRDDCSNSIDCTSSNLETKQDDKNPQAVAHLEFVATKQLNPEEVGVQFQNTVLIYTDPRSGKIVRQRLW